MRFTFEKTRVEAKNLYEAVGFSEEQVTDMMVAIWSTFKEDIDMQIKQAEIDEKGGAQKFSGEVLFSFLELTQAVAEKFEDLTKEQCLFIGLAITTEVEKCKQTLDLACTMGVIGLKALSEAIGVSCAERRF